VQLEEPIRVGRHEHDAAMSLPTRPPSETRVAVFGAGIAGLTVAHELVNLGYQVAVYESTCRAGGFFRSAREPHSHMPTEYSWHGMGPWYHNTFDLLRQIPFDAEGSMYVRALSRPIDFGIFPNDAPAGFHDHGWRSIPRMFRWSAVEFCRWAWLMLKVWTAGERSRTHYAALNAAAEWRPLLRDKGYGTWRACFGPWIGSDWTNVSLHTAGEFFRKQLTSRPAHDHPADEEGPAWRQGAGSGWLLLKGPSSEFWFDRWQAHLQRRGVAFSFSAPLHELEFNGSTIAGARLGSGESVSADYFVVAANPFAVVEILARTPALEILEQLRSFRPLTADGPHTQVSFRIAFGEPIRFPRARTAVVVAESAFNLTLFAQEQVWRPEVPLGTGIRSLWTGTSCVSTMPGPVHGVPVQRCTKQQFIDEVLAQIHACGALDALIREANGGRCLASFPILRVEVWHEWLFSPDGIQTKQPKWVTTTQTQPHQPTQATPVPNLFLAGAHTRTAADVWSVEGAVESGRRAAREIDSRVTVLPQYHPAWMRAIRRIDDCCHRFGAPHVLDLLVFGLLGAIVVAVARHLF
jgi:uncharacterized protein with NAD-binding domain and iron-sulfur cluster